MLNAKASSMQPTTTGSDPDRITPEMIAAALASPTLPVGASALVRVKWAGDDAHVEQLLHELGKAIAKKAKRNRWKMQSEWSHRWELLAALALRELEIIRLTEDNHYRAGAEKCWKCKGTGKRFSRKKQMFLVCMVCKGEDHKRMSRRKMADSVGLSDWSRVWNDRLAQTIEILSGWEAVALSLMVHRLGDS